MMRRRTSQRFFNIIDIGHFLTNQCRRDRILVEFIESLPLGCCVLQPAASFCAFFYQICRLFPPDVQKLIWLASHGKMLWKYRYFRPKNVTKWRNFSLISSLLSWSKSALPGVWLVAVPFSTKRAPCTQQGAPGSVTARLQRSNAVTVTRTLSARGLFQHLP